MRILKKRSKAQKAGTLTVRLPSRLSEQVDHLVEAGWFQSQQDIIEEAVRRFVENHRPEWIEQSYRDEAERVLREKK